MVGLAKHRLAHTVQHYGRPYKADWHILSNNMEGLTKHRLAHTVQQYVRPYRAQTGTYCPTILKALQSTDWHILSNSMEGLTKHRLAHTFQQYGRPYIARLAHTVQQYGRCCKAQSATYCPTIWKALQSTDWHILSNNMEGLTKHRLAHTI